MVKIYTNQNGQLFKVTCLSTDDKPIGVVPANTICEELDTGDKYFYDPVASQWVPYPGGSGSSPVPDPEVADIGKVLGIVEDGTGAKYAPVAGSGLPDPSTLTDGTAIVAVNGEWKMQEGYGYTLAPAFEPITWDGNTEGRESINEGTFFKVAEELDITALDGSVVTMTGVYTGEFLFVSTEEVMPNYYLAYYGEDTAICILTDDVDVGEGIILPKGVYFPNVSGYYVSSLTAPPSVHQFDSALIPASGGGIAVNLELAVDEEEGIIVTSADKTVAEVISAVQSGSSAVANLYYNGYIGMSFSFYQYNSGSVAFGYFWDATHERPSSYVIGEHEGASDEWFVQGLV